MLGEIAQYVLSFTGTMSLALVILLFLIAAIGEYGLSVPYLLETLWILSGFHVSTGALPVAYLLLLWCSAEAGRQVGSLSLYYVSRLGSSPVMRLYDRLIGRRVSQEPLDGKHPFKLIRGLNYVNPLSVAIGRLAWMRIPLTITLGVKRRPGTLLLGVLLSSLVWDAAYISLGLLGGSAALSPVRMMLYSLGGLTAFYLATLARRHFAKVIFWR
ncbi:MAG: hypothetical protein HYX96_01460 [Chloroflexi bacterium]|nr:hypothetical protein [Chloroflexota bacterium]